MKLTPRPGGFVLPVKVVPGASRTWIAGAYGDGIKVCVTAAPERGAANAAVIDLLAESLRISRANVSIVSGSTNPRKDVLIVGLDAATIAVRLGG
jgi:uncharacterized protein